MKTCPNCFTPNENTATHCMVCSSPLDDDPETTPLGMDQRTYGSHGEYQEVSGDAETMLSDANSWNQQTGAGTYDPGASQNPTELFSGGQQYSATSYPGRQPAAYSAAPVFSDMRGSAAAISPSGYRSAQPVRPARPVQPGQGYSASRPAARPAQKAKKKNGLKITLWTIAILLVAALIGFTVWWFVFRDPEAVSAFEFHRLISRTIPWAV